MLREVESWGPAPYQWAAAGYMGAIETGRTICGALFGGTVFLGYLNGNGTAGAPEVKDERREKAVRSVRELFRGFIKQFGHTDCYSLTDCDWSKREDIKRYFKEEIYRETCYRYFEYVLEACLEQSDLISNLKK